MGLLFGPRRLIALESWVLFQEQIPPLACTRANNNQGREGTRLVDVVGVGQGYCTVDAFCYHRMEGATHTDTQRGPAAAGKAYSLVTITK